MLRKIGLFMLSLWLLFVFIVIITMKIPVCFGVNCEFVGFKYLLTNNILPLISIIALIIGIFSYTDFLHRTDGTPELSFTVSMVENIDYEQLTFLTTYIIPLVCFQFENLRYLIVLFILLFVIGAIYIRTDIFYTNPTLALLGFRIFKIQGTFRCGEVRSNIILITKENIEKDDQVTYYKLDERIYYASKLKQTKVIT